MTVATPVTHTVPFSASHHYLDGKHLNLWMNTIVVLHLIPISIFCSSRNVWAREREIASDSSGESSSRLQFRLVLYANEETDNNLMRYEANSNSHEPHIFPSDAPDLTDGWVSWINSHFTIPLHFGLSITWSVIAIEVTVKWKSKRTQNDWITTCYFIIAFQDNCLLCHIFSWLNECMVSFETNDRQTIWGIYVPNFRIKWNLFFYWIVSFHRFICCRFHSRRREPSLTQNPAAHWPHWARDSSHMNAIIWRVGEQVIGLCNVWTRHEWSSVCAVRVRAVNMFFNRLKSTEAAKSRICIKMAIKSK